MAAKLGLATARDGDQLLWSDLLDLLAEVASGLHDLLPPIRDVPTRRSDANQRATAHAARRSREIRRLGEALSRSLAGGEFQST